MKKIIVAGSNSAVNLENGIQINKNNLGEQWFWLRSEVESEELDEGDPCYAYCAINWGLDIYKINDATGSVKPVFDLNVSDVLFASAVPSVSAAADLTDQMEKKVYTLRYDATGSAIADAAATLNQAQTEIRFTGIPSTDVYLVAQNEQGSCAVAITPTTYGVKASDLVIAGTALTDFKDCHIWLETTENRMTYAKEAEKLCKHSWSAWKVTKPATYDAAGEESRTCAICEEIQTRSIAKLNRISITKAAISGVSNKNYTGKAQTQSKMTVKADGVILKAGADYTVSYKNNKNLGTATITITGKGKYTGTIQETFKITVSKGKTYTVSSMKYKVTNASTNGKGTVTLTGTTKTKAKLTSLSIGNTVKIGGKSFKITAIGDNAFKGCSKLKKAVIGANVTTIGKSSFYNCKNLATLTIKGKNLKSVGKSAVKNIKKSAKIDVPTKQVKAYKKLFKSSTGYKKSMKIK